MVENKFKYSVTIDDRLHEIVLNIAHARDNSHGNAGNVKHPMGNAFRDKIHYYGAMGELAASIFFQTYWKNPVYSLDDWRKLFSTHIDFPGIEVRTSNSDFPYLPVRPRDHKRPIATYVKCRIDNKNKRLVWIQGHKWFREAIGTDYVYSEKLHGQKVRPGEATHLVPIYDLDSPNTLRQTILALRDYKERKKTWTRS